MHHHIPGRSYTADDWYTEDSNRAPSCGIGVYAVRLPFTRSNWCEHSQAVSQTTWLSCGCSLPQYPVCRTDRGFEDVDCVVPWIAASGLRVDRQGCKEHQ